MRLIVFEKAEGPTLDAMDPDAVTDAMLESSWTSVSRLHDARIAHGRIEMDGLVGERAGAWSSPISPEPGWPRQRRTVRSMSRSFSSRPQCCVGPDRALTAARTSIGDEALTAALPYVQPAALTPELRDEAHDGGLKVSDFRATTAAALDVPLPPIAELRRVTIKGLFFVALTAFAAWLIISQLADIGLSTIIDELQQASWEWLLVVLILGQLPLASQALSLTGAVPSPIPYAPTVALESGIKFVNLTVPSSAGRIAVNIRYLQKQGLSSTAAVSAGALDGVAGTIVEVILLLDHPPVHEPEPQRRRRW